MKFKSEQQRRKVMAILRQLGLTKIKKTLRSIKPVSPETFVAMRKKVKPEIARDLTHYTPDELRAGNVKLYMLSDKSAGYGLRPDGELINLFSLEKGRGKYALAHAILNGATHLDCVGRPKLLELYQTFGFVTYRTEANWTKGEPDIHFMRRRW